MTHDVSRRAESHSFAWLPALSAAAVTFLVGVVMPPLAALAGIVALVTFGFGLRRRLPRRTIAIAAGVLAAVLCYLAIWAVGSIVDPGDAESGGVSVPPPSAPHEP